MRDPTDRLTDVLEAIAAIQDYVTHGSLDEPLVFDAVRMRLIEIGEAVKAINASFLESEPAIAWRAVAGTRDWLAHHYFDTARARIAETVETDLPVLAEATRRLLGS